MIGEAKISPGKSFHPDDGARKEGVVVDLNTSRDELKWVGMVRSSVTW